MTEKYLGTAGYAPAVRARAAQAHVDARRGRRRRGRSSARRCCSCGERRPVGDHARAGAVHRAGRDRRRLLRLHAVVRRTRRTLEKKRVGVIVIFFLCAALFWGGFEQQATTFNTFALDYTDRSLARRHVPGERAPGLVVPVDQPGLHHHLRAVLRVDLGRARRAQPRSVRAVQDGHGPGVVRRGLPHHDVGGAAGRVERRQGRAHLAAAWPT